MIDPRLRQQTIIAPKFIALKILKSKFLFPEGDRSWNLMIKNVPLLFMGKDADYFVKVELKNDVLFFELIKYKIVLFYSYTNKIKSFVTWNFVFQTIGDDWGPIIR